MHQLTSIRIGDARMRETCLALIPDNPVATTPRALSFLTTNDHSEAE